VQWLCPGLLRKKQAGNSKPTPRKKARQRKPTAAARPRQEPHVASTGPKKETGVPLHDILYIKELSLSMMLPAPNKRLN
jgi:hypothetical protein